MPSPVVIPPVFPEPFAVEWGQDEYGIFMGFAVERIVQRMRWIPPGRFVMGSPVDEVGRFDNEVQHRVELTQGFWLGDTPVTQALWEAVTGSNPSCFKSAERPVESVTWYDCQHFMTRLNELVPELESRLPTEEEWEYACRAGTTTTTWTGNAEKVEANFAFWLDNIAWYAGNSFFDETEWQTGENKKYRQGTHPVRRKLPNPLGIYDILGNVYEYCSDIYIEYVDKLEGYTNGNADARTIRGGSWRSLPKYVRAANRGEQPLWQRPNDLGLRLARSPAPR